MSGAILGTRPRYAGVGSRQTPEAVCRYLYRLAHHLRVEGWVVRTGGASGADWAFMDGAGMFARGARDLPAEQAPAEVYIPQLGWRGISARPGVFPAPPPGAYTIAGSHHPEWARLGALVRDLHERNVCQILGPDPEGAPSPAHLLICWTPDGAACARETSVRTGGTGMAIRLADAYDVPVFNFGRGARTYHALSEWMRRRGAPGELPPHPYSQ